NLPASNSSTNDMYVDMSVLAWEKLYNMLQKTNKYGQFRNDFEESMIASIYWHFNKLNAGASKQELASKAVQFFTDINLRTVNEDAVAIYLAARSDDLRQLFEEKKVRMAELEAEYDNLRNYMNDVS